MSKTIYKRLLSFMIVLAIIASHPATVQAFGLDSDTIRLKKPDESGNTAFFVENMFPGDVEVKDFTVKVQHNKPVILYYRADLHQESEKLAEVMMIKIELPEKKLTLYEGTMNEMPKKLEHELKANEKEVIYRMTVSLDTSVGNEYQFQQLGADFVWWYAYDSANGLHTPETDIPETDIPETNLSDDPKTGDNSNLMTYILLSVGSLAIVFFLLILTKRKKEEKQYE